MKNNRGMALVVALLTSFILLALVASLFWVIASTSRQAEYAKNSAIALNLAEAGTADAIYRLNYCGTDGNGTYPFDNTFFPLSGVGSDTSILLTLPANIFPNPPPVSLCIQGTLNGGNYYVGLIDDPTGADTIIAVGVYKGIRRILTVPLRGNNDVTQPRHPIPATVLSPGVTQGISEAFNKHAIYADTVTAGTNTIVYGNIAYKNPSIFPTLGTWTKTMVAPELFALPIPNPPPVAISDPNPVIPPFATIFKDDDGLNSPYVGAVGYAPNFLGYYSGTPGAETYILNSSCTINTNEVWRFEKFSLDPAVNLTVTINAAALSTINGKIVVIGGSVEILGSSADYVVGNASPGQVTIWAENTIDIQPGSGILTINGDAYCRGGSASGIRIIPIIPDGQGRINGWLKSGGIIYVASTKTIIGQSGTPTGLIAAGTITLNGGTVYGGLSSGTGIDLTSTANNIYADNDTTDAALWVSSGGDATVNFNEKPAAFNLGKLQTAALSVFSNGGNTTVNIRAGADFTPIYSTQRNDQAAIVAYTSSLSPSKYSAVNINATTGAVDNGRLIYAFGTDTTTTGITIAAGQNVYGSLITNGTVTLNPGSSLTYDPSSFTGANPGSGSDIFAGFGGGRRAYVPAWKGWRLR